MVSGADRLTKAPPSAQEYGRSVGASTSAERAGPSRAAPTTRFGTLSHPKSLFCLRQKPAPDADLKTLHIRCGHDIQERIAEAFVGDFWPYVTPFCVGPVSKGPDRNELMARFIVDTFPEEDGSRTYEGELEALVANEQRLLRTADDYERVVIWKEQDTWCQTVLAHLLEHYANAKRPRVLELIALNEFPGAERFTGMGQLPSEALRMLWSTRKRVTPAQLALGNEVWNAFSSDDPRPLAAIFRSGTPALPIMAPAAF